MNARSRTHWFVALLIFSGCDRSQVTEVARTVHQDRKNRIVRCLVDCEPRVTTNKKGTELAYSVIVPDHHLANAMERLRVYGLDRDPAGDEPASMGFDTSETQRQILENRRRVRAIERAIAEDPGVFSVSVVLGTEKVNKGSPMSEGSSEQPRALGSGSVVMRAILETDREAESILRLENLARDVVRGAGFEPTSVAVVALPPLPTPPDRHAARDSDSAQSSLATGIADPGSGSLGIAASFVLNAVFLAAVAVLSIRTLRRNALARNATTRPVVGDSRKPLERAVSNQSARATT